MDAKKTVMVSRMRPFIGQLGTTPAEAFPDSHNAGDFGAFLDMTIPEVMNRVTITGSIDIGRAPGVVTVSLRAPKAKLVEKQIWEIVREQYHLD